MFLLLVLLYPCTTSCAFIGFQLRSRISYPGARSTVVGPHILLHAYFLFIIFLRAFHVRLSAFFGLILHRLEHAWLA